MKSIFKIWDNFFFSQFDPVSLSIFRILLGSTIFLMFIAEFPNWERFFSSNGVLSLNEPFYKPPFYKQSVFFYFEQVLPVKYLWYLGFIFSITFTAGLFTKLSTIFLYVFFISKAHFNPLVGAGYDLLIVVLLFYSCFTNLNYYLSIDNIVSKKRRELPLVWPVRLIQISIILIYITTGLYKLVSDPAWLNGEAAYWTIVQNIWGRSNIFPLLGYKILFFSKIATYFALLVELLFPVFVCIPATRLFAVLATVFFHLMLIIFMNHVDFFQLSMISALLLFIPDSKMKGYLIRAKILK